MNPDLPTGDPGGSSPADERVLIRIFGTYSQADVAVSSLEARGIQCWTVSDDAGGMLPNLTMAEGIRLFVLKRDAEDATAILNAPQPERQPDREATPTPIKRSLYFDGFCTGFLVSLILCLIFFGSAFSGKKNSGTYYHHGEMAVYNKNGTLSHWYKDRNGDGNWDYWADYDQSGVVTVAKEDNNFDGKPDVFWYYTGGELVRMQQDTDFNGVPDVTYYYTNGMIVRGDWTPNGSTNITKRYLFTKGILYQELRDTAGRGYFDQQVIYDAFENPIATNAVAQPITSSP